MVIVGGGFAGINAALDVAKLPVDVTLVDRKNYHLFQPLLYQVALAVLSPAEIARPIRSLLRNYPNVEVLMDEAVGFDLPERRVHLKTGVELEYDFLILATGSTHSYFGRDDWAKLAPGLKTAEDALEIRRRVLLAFELAEREMMEKGTHPALNFVIVGGGPTGVELAGAISDIAKLYMVKDFRHIDPSMAQVLILEGSPNILAAYPEDLQRKAGEQLNALGVKFRTNAHVTDVQPGYVMVGDERIDAVVILWAAGVQASPLGKMLGVPTDRRGCVFVDGHLNPPGHPEVFVCGDLAHVEENGRQIPGVAQPAMQMGKYAAKTDCPAYGGRSGEAMARGRMRTSTTSTRGIWRRLGGRLPWRHQVAVQRPLERVASVDDVADGAHLFSDWVQEQAVGVFAVGVDVSDVPRWASADYGLAGAAGVECGGPSARGFDDEAAGYGFAEADRLVWGKAEGAAIESLPLCAVQVWMFCF